MRIRAAKHVIVAIVLFGIQRTTTADDGVFAREVQPLLARHCFACHGPDEAEGGLSFHTETALTAETDSGESAIVPGDADASEMIRRVLSREDYEQMPPEGDRLTNEQVATLKKWINDGADFVKHWSFEPPVEQPLPDVNDTSWPNNGVDRFVLARLESNKLSPVAKASRRDLIRRVTHDLIGLPPTFEEVEAFVADDRPEAYSELIERLLASPHYGERWGRHWLDVIRFAETNSFERDNPKPNAWKFRDYVVDSFNEDKPYDQFVLEQLAGDELEDRSPETLTGTGYLRLGIWDDEPADPTLHRFEQLDDLVSTTSQAMLGLTVGCARCHDHKIDPIPQADYYSLAAFFNGMTEYARRGDQMQAEWSQIDISPEETLAEHARLDDEIRAIETKMYEAEQVAIARMSGPNQRLSEGPRRKKLLREQLDNFFEGNEKANYRALKKTKEAAEKSRQSLPSQEFVLGVAKADPAPKPMHVMQRGNAHVPGERVEPAFLSILGGGTPKEFKSTEETSGRRLELAKWIASNPGGMTARVAVNRIWQHHFGNGIVRTPNNVGQLGAPPTHPKLLDWLAQEFVRQGWSTKAIHRLILQSATYQLSTNFNAEAAAKDPANLLYWRRDLRRMDAEEVRDSILAVCDNLNPQIGGPSVYPAIEEEIRQGLSRPDAGWPTTMGEEANRRSLYIFVKRSLVMPLLVAFDYPDPDSSCEARFKTTQPGQSLALLNSDFLQSQADALTASLEAGEPISDTTFVERLFQRVLLRKPTSEESKAAIRFLASEEPSDSPRKLLALLALNMNEFVYIP